MIKTLFFVFLSTNTVWAHLLVQGVGTQSVFTLRKNAIGFELNVGFSPTAGFLEMVKIDADRNGTISRDEADRFARTMFEKVKDEIELRVDDKLLKPVLRGSRTENLVGKLGQHAFDLYYALEVKLPASAETGLRVVQYTDNTFRDEYSSQFHWLSTTSKSPVYFHVIEPEAETIVDTVKVTGREMRFLMAAKQEPIDAWMREHRDDVASSEKVRAPLVNIFENVGRDQLPVCELVIHAEKPMLRMVSERMEEPDKWPWRFQVTANGTGCSVAYQGSTPFTLDPVFTCHLFTIDIGSGQTDVVLAITAPEGTVQEYRLKTDGHDPTVRWSLLSPYLLINKGYFSILGGGLKVQWKRLSFVNRSDGSAARKTEGSNGEGPEAASSRSKETDPLLDAFEKIKSGTLGLWGLAVICVLVFFQGMLHAFAPGHGKSLVAAYLAGKQGRIRDAVVLGIIVTVTHLGSVYALALGGLALIPAQNQSAYKDQVVVALQLVSCVLLVGLGLVLLKRALHRKETHEHHHHHHFPWEKKHHHHGHVHDHAQEEPPRAMQLLLVGLTGGIVPCPAGLTAVFVAWYLNLFWTALVLLFFLSLGLGGSLIAIGVSVVLTRKAFEKRSRSNPESILPHLFQRLLGILPVFSALFITCLGIFLCVVTLVSRGDLVAALFRSLLELVS